VASADNGSTRSAAAESQPPDDRLTAGDYALFALHSLGGGEHDVDLEDIAVEAFRLAPSMFSWRRHKELPSIEAVRISFRNLEATHRAQLVVSHRGHDRMLTPTGIKRAQQVRQLIGVDQGPAVDHALRRPINRELGRMSNHPAYLQWKEGGVARLDRLDLGDLLHVVSGAPVAAYQQALMRAESQATSVGFDELTRFVGDCLDHLNAILSRSPA
jgi:hypothetical protein